MKKQIPRGLAPQQRQTEKKKIHLTQILRHVIQLIALILMPGLFITAFSALRDVWQAVLQGNITVSGLSSQLVVLAAVFPVTVIWGRFFCGYLCSFGAMGDLMAWISSKIRRKPLQIPPKADRALKFVKYGVLAFLVIAVWTLGLSMDASVSPWNVFGVLVTLWKGGSVRSLASVGMLLLVLIFVGSLLVDRFFCRYLCPLGAVFALVSRIRLFRIFKKQPEACGSCRMCTIHCSMGISLNQTERVKDSECIECFHCVDVCPRSNMTSSAAPAIAGTAAAVAVGGIYFAGTYAAAGTAPAGQTAVSSEQGQYKDGTYTGSAQGYRGTTTVSVTVKNGNITDISIESTGDDAEFFNKAKNTVIQEILSEQTTKGVDTVSGATFSSNGIIQAVADALGITDSSDSARTDGSGSSGSDSGSSSDDTTGSGSDSGNSSDGSSGSDGGSSSDDSTDSSSENDSDGTSDSLDLSSVKDGTYTGTGTGFRGETKVSVTVKSHKITDITIESYEDDEQYFQAAQTGMISEILKQQSLSVDTVSGATFSSNGILEAVADALQVDFDNPNESSSGEFSHGHGGHGGSRSYGGDGGYSGYSARG
ncbi:MAG TPA: FMN-binding protein [Lachnospiraceae bacterium]|nr:FMN-binding protein [Lachnospiraceae bacterium]